MTKTLLSLCLLAASLAAQQPADLIVTAAQVVTMDAERRVINDGAVAIRNGRILAVGPRQEIDSAYRAAQRIDQPEAMLTPGLVNTHTHASMSLLRGLADDKPLQEWLEKYIFPAEARNVTPEFVRWGARLAMLEMMLSGTTTYTDMYYFEDDIAEVTAEAGMRGVLGQTIIGFPAPDYKTPAAALAGTAKFIEKWKGHPLITPAVAPHAVYTNDGETLAAARALADRHNVPLLIHVSETRAEDAIVEKKTGASPTAYLDRIGGIARRSVFAHGVWLSPLDRQTVRLHGVGVAHCPSSNLKLGSGILPTGELLRLGIPVGLGPDGPAGSNNDFNLFEEMDLASKLAKGATHDPLALPAATVFEMATIMGARVLGMEDQIGSLEPGKRADLITISLAEPHAFPRHDPYSMLVYSLKGSDVRDVVIEGRITIRDRRPLTLNPKEILTRAAELRARVEASLKEAQP
jgi:5-methylthioadenosine/S-adenosylhomocysteine deaminase